MKTTLLTILILPAVALAAPGWNDSYADYSAIRDSLAKDSLDGVSDHAKALSKKVSALHDTFDATAARVAAASASKVKSILANVAKAADAVASATDLEKVRSGFGTLSLEMMSWRRLLTGEQPAIVHCPMAKKYWMQAKGDIKNPYLGTKMINCGVFEKDAKATKPAS